MKLIKAYNGEYQVNVCPVCQTDSQIEIVETEDHYGEDILYIKCNKCKIRTFNSIKIFNRTKEVVRMWNDLTE